MYMSKDQIEHLALLLFDIKLTSTCKVDMLEELIMHIENRLNNFKFITQKFNIVQDELKHMKLSLNLINTHNLPKDLLEFMFIQPLKLELYNLKSEIIRDTQFLQFLDESFSYYFDLKC